MPQYEELPIGDFSLGLVTSPSAVESAKNSFKVFKNLEGKRPGLAVPFPGAGTAQLRVEGTLTDIPAIPSGLTLEGDPFIFHTVTPGSGSDVIVIFGSKGGRDRFYIWPSITTAGAWSTDTGTKVSGSYISWLELTEAVATTISSVTSSAVLGDTIVLAAATGLDEATNDYHKHWYAMVFQSNGTYRGSTYIHTWTAATRTAQTVFGVSPSANDIIVLMRFPIFRKISTLTTHYQIDSLPSFSQHGQNVVIHTGAHAIDDGPDLWLGYIDRTYFGSASGASNLDFKGWHFDHAQPWEIKKSKTAMNTWTAVSPSDDPLPASDTIYYIGHHNPVYDGIEEANIYYDAADLFNQYSYIANNDGDKEFRNDDFMLNWAEDFDRNSQYAAGSNFNSILSRRVTKLRVYLAKAEAISGTSSFRPTSSFYFVKEIDIDDSSWVRDGASGEFEIDYTVYGRDWFEGQKFPFSAVNGYEISKTGANTIREAQVGTRVFIGPVYDDTKKTSRVLFCPLRLSGESAPEVFPASLRVDTIHQGIYEIVALAEQFGRLVILGSDSLAVAIVSGENRGEVVESFSKVGCVAARTARNLEGLLFFSSQQKLFEIFNGNKVLNNEDFGGRLHPAERIQDIWESLTVTQKQASFAGVHRDRREYWIHIDDGSILGRTFVYSLNYDNLKEYVPASNVYIGFGDGANGELFAITASGVVGLASGSPTEEIAITLQTQTFNTTFAHYRRLRMNYKSPTGFVATPIDDGLAATALRERESVLFLAQTDYGDNDQEVSMETSRFVLRLTRSASNDTTAEIESIGIARVPKRER